MNQQATIKLGGKLRRYDRNRRMDKISHMIAKLIPAEFATVTVLAAVASLFTTHNIPTDDLEVVPQSVVSSIPTSSEEIDPLIGTKEIVIEKSSDIKIDETEEIEEIVPDNVYDVYTPSLDDGGIDDIFIDMTVESDVMTLSYTPQTPMSYSPANLTGFTYYPEISLSKELQQYTYQISEEYGLRYTLLLSMMYRESGFITDITGVNTDGTVDSGLMGINDTARPFLADFEIYNLLDPYENIRAGAEILTYCFENSGNNEQCALMAYQYGVYGSKKKFEQNIWDSDANRRLRALESELLTHGKFLS